MDFFSQLVIVWLFFFPLEKRQTHYLPLKYFLNIFENLVKLPCLEVADKTSDKKNIVIKILH